MPSSASPRPAPVIASPWTNARVAGTPAGSRPKPRSSWPSAVSAGTSLRRRRRLAPVRRIRTGVHRRPSACWANQCRGFLAREDPVPSHAGALCGTRSACPASRDDPLVRGRAANRDVDTAAAPSAHRWGRRDRRPGRPEPIVHAGRHIRHTALSPDHVSSSARSTTSDASASEDVAAGTGRCGRGWRAAWWRAGSRRRGRHCGRWPGRGMPANAGTRSSGAIPGTSGLPRSRRRCGW